MSSTLQRSSRTQSVSSAVSPSIARKQFAISKSLLPIPYPTAVVRRTGISPNRVTKYFSSAAPVGVHSSLRISPLYMGMPRSRYAVAGAGTGRMPCAQCT